MLLSHTWVITSATRYLPGLPYTQYVYYTTNVFKRLRKMACNIHCSEVNRSLRHCSNARMSASLQDLVRTFRVSEVTQSLRNKFMCLYCTEPRILQVSTLSVKPNQTDQLPPTKNALRMHIERVKYPVLCLQALQVNYTSDQVVNGAHPKASTRRAPAC